MDNRLKVLTNSLGVMFLGDWLIDKYNDKELKTTIHILAEREIYNAAINNRSVERIDNVVILSLILIAIEHYDGSFWPHIDSYYPSVFPKDGSLGPKSDQWIYSKLREKITYLYGETNSGSRIINHLLVEAFVPKNYLDGFFKFAYAILKYNYDYYLFDENDEESKEEVEKELLDFFAYLFSNTKIDDEEKELSFDFDNNYSKYELITSTKKALGDENVAKALLPLIMDILEMLESQFFGRDLSKFTNEYLLFGLNEWNKKLNKNSEKTSNNNITTDRSVIRPKVIRFNDGNRTITLKTRRHNITNFNRGDNVKMIVKNNGFTVYENNSPAIKQIMGAYRIDPVEIEIKKFFGVLEYSLIINDRCYYSSKNLLNFDYMIFDSKGEYLSNYNVYEGNIIVLTSSKLIGEDSRYSEVNGGFAYYINKTHATILDFGTIKVTHENIIENLILGELNKISATNNGEKIDVYKKVKKIRVEDNYLDKNKLYLSINNTNIKIATEDIQQLENNGKYFLEISLDKLNLKSNLYEIKVMAGRKGSIANFTFILDKEIRVKEKLRNGIELTQKLDSSFFDQIVEIQDIPTLEKEEITVIEKEFTIRENIIKYIKLIEVDNYEIFGKIYHPNRYIWNPEIEEGIKFNFNGIRKIRFQTLDNKGIEEYDFEEQQNQYFIHKHNLNIMMDKNDVFGINIIIFTKNKRYILKVLKNNYLIKNKNEIFFTEDKYYLDLSYIGRNSLDIEIYQNKVRLDNKNITSSGFVELPLKRDLNMKVLIVEGKENPFLGTKRRVLKEIEFFHYSIKSLVSKNYQIESIYAFEEDTSYSVRNTFIKDLRYINGEVLGTMFFTNKRHRFVEFSDLNPVKLNFIGEVYSSDKFFSVDVQIVDNDEDGLILGSKSKEVSYDGNTVKKHDDAVLVDNVKLIASEVRF